MHQRKPARYLSCIDPAADASTALAERDAWQATLRKVLL